MDGIRELIEKVRATDTEVWVDGPQPESAIAELETLLGVSMPPSYRAFLSQFGSMLIVDSAISGIMDGNPREESLGSVYFDTVCMRDEHNFPEHFIVVNPNDEGPYCLDASKPSAGGEYPVMCCETFSDSVRLLWPDFDAFLRETLTAWLG